MLTFAADLVKHDGARHAQREPLVQRAAVDAAADEEDKGGERRQPAEASEIGGQAFG